MKKIVLNVAIEGPAGSGKRSLRARLDTHCLHRNNAVFTFRGHVHPGANLAVDFTVALLNVYADYTYSPYSHLTRARELTSAARACVVGTMVDTIRSDYSNEGLEARRRHTQVVYYYKSAYFSVNCLNGQGVDALCEHIIDVVTGSSRPRIRGLASYLDQLSTYMVDFVASVFALPVPQNVNQDTPDIEELDETAILQLVKSPIAAAWRKGLVLRAKSDEEPSDMPTHQISPTLIAKQYIEDNELVSMDYVRQHTTIPVPQVRHRHLEGWLISDFIEGEMLFECWDNLSMFKKFRIACTIRGYLTQLRRLKGMIPGRIGSHTIAGPHFDYAKQGPFRSVKHFQTWYEMIAVSGWCTIARHYRNIGIIHELEPFPVPSEEPWDIVFSHGDINITNLILTRDGVLWVIDWAESGFYPSWFDGMIMASFKKPPRSWHLLRPLMAGMGGDRTFTHFWQFVTQDIKRYDNHYEPPSE